MKEVNDIRKEREILFSFFGPLEQMGGAWGIDNRNNIARGWIEHWRNEKVGWLQQTAPTSFPEVETAFAKANDALS